MRLLIDANLSPVIAALLVRSGYTATHVADLGLLVAPDDIIFARAAENGYIVVTADNDFPMMLALRRATNPSVVLLRHVEALSTAAQAELLTANLPSVTDDLDRGAIVSLSPTRMAVRQLPIGAAAPGRRLNRPP